MEGTYPSSEIRYSEFKEKITKTLRKNLDPTKLHKLSLSTINSIKKYMRIYFLKINVEFFSFSDPVRKCLRIYFEKKSGILFFQIQELVKKLKSWLMHFLKNIRSYF